MSASRQDRVIQAKSFLIGLFVRHRSGFIEFRAFKSGTSNQRFFEALPLEPIRLQRVVDRLLRMADEGFDVYVGVLPRSARSGKSDAITVAGWFWVDLDAKNLTPAEIEAATADADMVVASGSGGAHGYWRSVHVKALATRQERKLFETALKKFQARVSGGKADHTQDAARILRLPGTFNHKSDPPKPVTLVRGPLAASTPGKMAAPPEDVIDGKLVDAANAGMLPALSTPIFLHSGLQFDDANDAVLHAASWHRFARNANKREPGRPTFLEMEARYRADLMAIQARLQENTPCL